MDEESRGLEHYIDKGLQAMKNQQFEEAAEAFNAAIEAAPDNPIGYTNFGNLLVTIQQPEKALNFYEKAIDIDHLQASAYYGCAGAFFNMEKYEEAIAYYKKANEHGVEDADIHFMMGRSYYEVGQNMMALVHLQRSVELDTKDIESRFQYALCLAKTNQIDLSIEQLEYILQSKPEHADACYNLGVAKSYKGEVSEAKSLFKRALAVQENHMLAAHGLKQLEKQQDEEKREDQT